MPRVILVHAHGTERVAVDLPEVPRLNERVAVQARDGVWEYIPVTSVRWQPRHPEHRSAIHGDWEAEVHLGT